VSNSWPTKTVEQLSEIVAMGPFGSSIKVSTFVDNGIPIISGQHLKARRLEDGEFNFITEEHAEKLSKANVIPGDVIFTHAGNIGQVAYIPKDSAYPKYVISQRQFYCRPDQSQALSEWIAAYFTAPQGRHALLSNASSTGVPSIARPVTHLRSLPVPLPPLAEQRNAVSVLESLDDKIELNRQTARTLEELAQRLFKSWFVDFDPVRAKMVGRKPAHTPPDIANLFPDGLVDSPLGPIPEGWAVVPFGELLSFAIGGDWGTAEPDKKHSCPVSIVRGTDIPALRGSDFTTMPSRWVDPKKYEKRRLEPFDLVVEVSGGSKNQPTGRNFFVQHSHLSIVEELVPASFCRLMRPISPRIGLLLAEHLDWLYSRGGTWEYQNRSTGISNFQTKIFLENELVCVPPDDVLQAFYELVMPMRERTVLLENPTLVELRDRLLPKLISGEIRVADDGSGRDPNYG